MILKKGNGLGGVNSSEESSMVDVLGCAIVKSSVGLHATEISVKLSVLNGWARQRATND